MRDRFFADAIDLRLVDDFDEIERRSRDLFAGGGNRRDRIADKPHLCRRRARARPGRRENAERNRQIPSGEYGVDTLEARRSRGIDRADARVRLGAAQQLAVQLLGNARSSANRVVPVTFATASTLRRALPMMECWTVGMLEGGSPSNRPTFQPLRRHIATPPLA